MESNVSVRQCKEGLSHSCHPGRGLQLIPHAGLTKSGVKPGGDESPPSGIGPWLGARVAPQHCPILRPGQDHGKQNGSSLQLQPNVGFQKEDISNELRMRTFLTSCDIIFSVHNLFRARFCPRSSCLIFPSSAVLTREQSCLVGTTCPTECLSVSNGRISSSGRHTIGRD